MFQKIQESVRKFIAEKGQGIVEYALILGFVAIIALGLFKAGGLSDTVKSGFSGVDSEVKKMNEVITGSVSEIKVPRACW